MAVPVTTAGTFRAGSPTTIYRAKDAFDGYDVTPDGQRFLIMQDAEKEPKRLEIGVVPDWFEELMTKAGGSRR